MREMVRVREPHQAKASLLYITRLEPVSSKATVVFQTSVKSDNNRCWFSSKNEVIAPLL
jgi:hypothetical protein